MSGEGYGTAPRDVTRHYAAPHGQVALHPTPLHPTPPTHRPLAPPTLQHSNTPPIALTHHSSRVAPLVSASYEPASDWRSDDDDDDDDEAVGDDDDDDSGPALAAHREAWDAGHPGRRSEGDHAWTLVWVVPIMVERRPIMVVSMLCMAVVGTLTLVPMMTGVVTGVVIGVVIGVGLLG